MTEIRVEVTPTQRVPRSAATGGPPRAVHGPGTRRGGRRRRRRSGHGRGLGEQLRDKDADTWTASEVKLSFQLALQAEAGVVIARAKTAATFSVDVVWRRRAEPDQ